jgi:translation initiation factor IF-2
MTKKRVYELAKELGIENKDLINHLGTLGVSVKSVSSSLEDSDVERVSRLLRKGEPHGTEETRVKPTVIRRRSVQMPVEEPEVAAAEVIAPVAGKKEEEALTPVAQVTPKTARKETGAKVTESLREATAPPLESGPSSAGAANKEAVNRSDLSTDAAAAKSLPPEGKPAQTQHATIVKPATALDQALPGKGKSQAAFPPRTTSKPQFPSRFQESRRDAAPKPGLAVPKPVIAPPFEDKNKKKTRAPVEVLMEDQPAVKKRAFIKKIVEKKTKRDDLDSEERPSRWRETKKAVVKMQKTAITVPKAVKRRIKVGETISVGELAKKMGVKVSEVINKLIALGMMATINQPIDCDAATLIATEFGYQVESSGMDYDEEIQKAEISPEKLRARAPVVTVMGHVDHGKTSLLDAIRETNVIGGEAGGITQAIGAYHVHIKNRDIVFLDTPGHEAFTAMRARGAKVTDIVVLVVAADDGVMEQTVEAINHSRSAGVPIIVAINKIDKPGADPEKIKQALTEYNLLSEAWGGDTIFCEISAKKKLGIEELLEMILLQADIMDLKADPDRFARGVVIEAKLDRGRGPVATILIQEGTLREGDAFVAKSEFGRVRAMINDSGKRVKEAGPSFPVEVIGFSRVPQAGTEFVCLEDEKKTRSIAEYWIRKERARELSEYSKITLEQLYQKIKEGVKAFNVIIKGDVQGSIEALTDALNKLSTADVKLKIIHASAGAITETDVMLASASNALIIGFNVRPDSRVSEVAEQEGVEIKLYDIIYNVIADMKAAMEGLLEPIYRQVVQGRAEVRQLFKVPKIGTIAGCYVLDGKIVRSSPLKLVRNGVVVYDGVILSLRRQKDDSREVAAGFECGIGIEGYNDLREGDIIETYVNEEVARKL